jgi:hypothetical protein
LSAKDAIRRTTKVAMINLIEVFNDLLANRGALNFYLVFV